MYRHNFTFNLQFELHVCILIGSSTLLLMQWCATFSDMAFSFERNIDSISVFLQIVIILTFPVNLCTPYDFAWIRMDGIYPTGYKHT
jgi:hypothetical protein